MWRRRWADWLGYGRSEMAKATKKSTLLPNRSALKGLDKTQRTIADYAKLVPGAEASPAIIQNLAVPKGK